MKQNKKRILNSIRLVIPLLILFAVLSTLVYAAPVQWRYDEGGNGHWYDVIQFQGTFENASQHAETQYHNSIQGHLATITSHEESSFINSQILSVVCPPGVCESQHVDGFWLGGYQLDNTEEPSGKWAWLQDGSFFYTNWNTGEPNNWEGSEDCLALPWLGCWNDINCNKTLGAYVIEYDCQWKMRGCEERPFQWTEEQGGNGHWYQAIRHFSTWEEAKQQAASQTLYGLSGYLATITSKEEDEFVSQMLSTLSSETIPPYCSGSIGCSAQWSAEFGFWLGGQLNENGQWQWITSELWEYNRLNEVDPTEGLFLGIVNWGNSWRNQDKPQGSIMGQGTVTGYLLEYGPTPPPDEIEDIYQKGLNAGIKSCQTDPASCGIQTACSSSTYLPAEGVLFVPWINITDAFNKITPYEIKLALELETNSLSFSLQRAVPMATLEIPKVISQPQSSDDLYEQGVTAGITSCYNNPADCDIDVTCLPSVYSSDNGILHIPQVNILNSLETSPTLAYELDMKLSQASETMTFTVQNVASIMSQPQSQIPATPLISKSSTGNPANGSSDYPSISADGRYVAFKSDADNLVANDTNNAADIFVHDRQTGQTTRISVDNSGNQGNAESSNPLISANGEYVAFLSHADNLVADDSHGQGLFIHKLKSGQTTMVIEDMFRENFSISADARFIAYVFYMFDGKPPGIAVYDRQSGYADIVSVDSSGQQVDFNSYTEINISADGRYVVFNSKVTDSGTPSFFVHDRHTKETTLIPGYISSYSNQSLSADGRYIIFENDTNNSSSKPTVFIYDQQSRQTDYVSIANNGSISPNGRYLFFTDLIADSYEHTIYIHERLSKQTTNIPVSLSNNGYYFQTSNDGRFIVFMDNGEIFVHDSALTDTSTQ